MTHEELEKRADEVRQCQDRSDRNCQIGCFVKHRK